MSNKLVYLEDGGLAGFLESNPFKMVCVVMLDRWQLPNDMFEGPLNKALSKVKTVVGCVVDLQKCRKEAHEYEPEGHITIRFFLKGAQVHYVCRGGVSETIEEGAEYVEKNAPASIFQGTGHTLGGGDAPAAPFAPPRREKPLEAPPEVRPPSKKMSRKSTDVGLQGTSEALELVPYTGPPEELTSAQKEAFEDIQESLQVTGHVLVTAMRATGSSDVGAIAAWLEKYNRGEVSGYKESHPIAMTEPEISAEVDRIYRALFRVAPPTPEVRDEKMLEAQRIKEEERQKQLEKKRVREQIEKQKRNRASQPFAPSPRPGPLPPPSPRTDGPIRVRFEIGAQASTYNFEKGQTWADIMPRLVQEGLVQEGAEVTITLLPDRITVSPGQYQTLLKNRDRFQITTP